MYNVKTGRNGGQTEGEQLRRENVMHQDMYNGRERNLSSEQAGIKRTYRENPLFAAPEMEREGHEISTKRQCFFN